MPCILLLLLSSLLAASDWPRFRGPNGAGVSPDKPLAASFDKAANVAWTVKTPKGNSSPVVAGGKLLITGEDGGQRVVHCYRASNGELLWKRSVDKARAETAHPLNGHATPSIATDGKAAFAYFPDFGLIAHDLDGTELWRVPLPAYNSIQGMAVSPVYAEGNVILFVDTPEEALLTAYDARTGKKAWQTERPAGFLGSYATPSLYQPAKGPTQLIVAGAVELTGYNAKTGERIWWARGVTYGPAALPLVHGDSVYTIEPSGEGAPPFSQPLKDYDKDGDGKIAIAEITSEGFAAKIWTRILKSVDKHGGDNDGVITEEEFKSAFAPSQTAGGLVRVKLGGTGDISANVLWRHRKGLPYVTAPVMFEGVLYSVRNGGILSAFDPESGKILREERLKDAPGEYYASPVAGDGKIYFVNVDGKASIIRSGRDWELIASAELGEKVIATPAIAQNLILVRTEQAIYAFSAKAAKLGGAGLP